MRSYSNLRAALSLLVVACVLAIAPTGAVAADNGPLTLRGVTFPEHPAGVPQLAVGDLHAVNAEFSYAPEWPSGDCTSEGIGLEFYDRATNAWKSARLRANWSTYFASSVLGLQDVRFRQAYECTAGSVHTNEVVRRVNVVAAATPKIKVFTVPSTTDSANIRVGIVPVPRSEGGGEPSRMRFADESGEWGAWVPFSATFAPTVSAGLGYKAIYAQISDGTRESSVVMRRFTRVKPKVDAPGVESPTVRSVVVSAPTHVGSTSVRVAANDDTRVTGVRFATEDGDWTGWQPYTIVLRAPVVARVGTRGLYTQVRDAGGRESNIVYVKFVNRATATDPFVKGGGVLDRSLYFMARALGVDLPASHGPRVVGLHLHDTSLWARNYPQFRYATNTGGWGAWTTTTTPWDPARADELGPVMRLPATPATDCTNRAGFGCVHAWFQLRDTTGRVGPVWTTDVLVRDGRVEFPRQQDPMVRNLYERTMGG